MRCMTIATPEFVAMSLVLGRDTLENSPGLTPAAPMRLRRPESGSRGREAGASRIFILSPGGAPPMENSYGMR